MELNKTQMNHNAFENWFAWVCGVVGGGVHFTFLEIHANLSDWLALGRAGITAVVCGFLGMAGKEIYRKIFKKRKPL